ncbi:MAG: cysteine--tRNA ligase [Deltaproteobacteria bacterium]|nr:MAG: cysteine--tRNA ligase [Deltaproteobacteria bacterium]
MTLRLYNTLTSQKETFEPADPDLARIYYCGPTVYDYAHLGHARSAIVYDILVRHLRANGTKVLFVRNVTDIDDKIIKRSVENGEEPAELAKRFEAAYQEDMRAVGNIDPDIEPRVSEHLTDIHKLIQRLIDNGSAYEAGGDVYFRVKSFKDYGKLSHRKMEDHQSGASGRTADTEQAKKESPEDFALWKGNAGDGPSWSSPWGEGRPGWHIECSAMSMAHLGDSFDLHGGGLDLVFPHHENEIAQSEAATGKPMAKYWMHNGFIEVNKEKMSKSLGNFFTARELYKRVEPEAVRWFNLTCHYRAPLNLDWTVDEEGNITGFPQFEEAERRVEYLYNAKKRLADIPAKRIVPRDDALPEELGEFPAKLAAALDEDLSFPAALAEASAFLKAVNDLTEKAKGKKGKAPLSWVEAANLGFERLDAELGLGTKDADAVLLGIRDRRAAAKGIEAATVEAKIAERAQARADKDFERADAVRGELTAMGVELLDSPEGTVWTVS